MPVQKVKILNLNIMNKKSKNLQICILGHARHGKDTFAEILEDKFDFKFKSSSMAASEIFIYDLLKTKYDYKSFEECFEDRVNHRAEWHDLICEYNKDNKARLASEILEDVDCYVGMRSDKEIDECVRQGLFDLIIWVDASERLPLEPRDSFKIDKSYVDVIVDNNGTLEQFTRRVLNLGKILYGNTK